MIVLTPEKTIRRINKAGLSISGYATEEILGMDISRLFPDLLINSLDCIERNMTTEVNFLTKTGVVIPVSLSLSVFSDENCQILDYIMVAKDITNKNVKRLDMQVHDL